MINRLKRIAVVFLVVGAVVSKIALADSVDDYVSATLVQKKIPGASILVIYQGQVRKAQGYGFANVELRVPASADTVYQSGSTGKQFTAAGVLLLAEEGKLSLNERISNYFPNAPSGWHGITVRQLLTHTSGIRDYEDSPYVDLRKDYDEEALLKIMMRLPIDFEPGSQWSYSNSGYLILGLLTSKLTGMHWSEFQAQRLFKPLGMTTTRVISESDIVSNRAAGYELNDRGELKNQQWVSPSLNRCADGSLYYTIKDLAAWDAALRKRRFLKASSLDAWVRPVSLTNGAEYQYGFGWFVNEQRGQRLLEHGGSWQGFRTAIARYVDEGLTVAVLTNLSSAEPETMAHEIAGLLDPRLRIPDITVTRPDPAPGRSAKLQKLLADWADSRRDLQMTKGLAETATGSAEEAQWRSQTRIQLTQLSAFRFLAEDHFTAKSLSRRGEQISTIAYYALDTKDKRYAYRFYLTKEDRIADFTYEER
jgi:CubicO group peptidase (beta-lactamase class C family)